MLRRVVSPHAGTAAQLREMTEVPRTRASDAIRVLKSQGLVKVHRSSPQQFRTVPLEGATETLRDRYEARVERHLDTLDTVEIVDADDELPVHQGWATTGRDTIENRTNDLIAEATDAVVLVIGDD